MVFFKLVKIVCVVLIVSTFVNSKYIATNTGNVTKNEDVAIESAVCDPQKNDCKNGGTCAKQADFYYCDCLEGTSGEFCEEIQECKDTDFCGDRLRAKCYFDVETKGAACACYDKKKVFDPAKKVCKRTCGVRDAACENGGTCVKQGNYNHCACKEGTSGDLCEIVDDCRKNLCGLIYNQNCYFDVLKGKALCKCFDEDSIFDYDRKTCLKVCNAQNLCKNGGSCVNVGNYSLCSCLDGTRGYLCETVEECGILYSCGRDARSECYFDVEKEKAACRCDGKDIVYDAERRICRSPMCSKLCGNGDDVKCSGEGDAMKCECIKYQYTFIKNTKECRSPVCSKLCGNGGDVKCSGEADEMKCECTKVEYTFIGKTKECRSPVCSKLCGIGDDVKCSGEGDAMKCECKRYQYTFINNTKECRSTVCSILCGNGADVKCSGEGKAMTCECTKDKYTFIKKTQECRNPVCSNLCGNGYDVKCPREGDAKKCECTKDKYTFINNTKECRSPECSNLCGTTDDLKCLGEGDAMTCGCTKDKYTFIKNTKECRNPVCSNLCGNGDDVKCSGEGDATKCECTKDNFTFISNTKECRSPECSNLCGTRDDVKCSGEGDAMTCVCTKDEYTFIKNTKECRNGRSYNLITIMIYSIFAVGIFASILTSCFTLRGIQKIQRVLGKFDALSN